MTEMRNKEFNELPEVRIKEDTAAQRERATQSKTLFADCLSRIPHLFLILSKRKWRAMFKQRNQHN